MILKAYHSFKCLWKKKNEEQNHFYRKNPKIISLSDGFS